jgi:hypothetical protein
MIGRNRCLIAGTNARKSAAGASKAVQNLEVGERALPSVVKSGNPHVASRQRANPGSGLFSGQPIFARALDVPAGKWT